MQYTIKKYFIPYLVLIILTITNSYLDSKQPRSKGLFSNFDYINNKNYTSATYYTKEIMLLIQSNSSIHNPELISQKNLIFSTTPLNNLTSNDIKIIPPGSEITIYRSKDPIHFSDYFFNYHEVKGKLSVQNDKDLSQIFSKNSSINISQEDKILFEQLTNREQLNIEVCNQFHDFAFGEVINDLTPDYVITNIADRNIAFLNYLIGFKNFTNNIRIESYLIKKNKDQLDQCFKIKTKNIISYLQFFKLQLE